MRNGAIANTKELIKQAQAVGSTRLFSIRHDFPTEWAKFQGQAVVSNQRFSLKLNLREEHYPFFSQRRLNKVTRVDLLAKSANTGASSAVADKAELADASAKKDLFVRDPNLGKLLVAKLTNIGLPAKPVGQLQLFFDEREMSDLWLLVTWSE